MKEHAPRPVTFPHETMFRLLNLTVPVPEIVNRAYLFSGCQGGQEAFVLLLLGRCHDDKVLFVVKCPRSWLKPTDKRLLLKMVTSGLEEERELPLNIHR